MADALNPRMLALLEANAAALDMTVAPAHRAGVLAYLALAESMYRSLAAIDLGPADETALVFVPQPPGGRDA
ncbi:MAG: hypothetical protein ACKODB_08140 [Betaproteobacteria bacterium]|jgi:hypothetical protein